MPFQIDGRGDMNAFVLTFPLAGVMLLTRRQPFFPSAAHDKFFSICTAFGGYTKFGIAPMACGIFSKSIISFFSICVHLHTGANNADCFTQDIIVALCPGAVAVIGYSTIRPDAQVSCILPCVDTGSKEQKLPAVLEESSSVWSQVKRQSQNSSKAFPFDIDDLIQRNFRSIG